MTELSKEDVMNSISQASDKHILFYLDAFASEKIKKRNQLDREIDMLITCYKKIDIHMKREEEGG